MCWNRICWKALRIMPNLAGSGTVTADVLTIIVLTTVSAYDTKDRQEPNITPRLLICSFPLSFQNRSFIKQSRYPDKKTSGEGKKNRVSTMYIKKKCNITVDHSHDSQYF